MADCRLGRPLNVLIWLVPCTPRVDSQPLVQPSVPLASCPGTTCSSLPLDICCQCWARAACTTGKSSSLFNPCFQLLLWWGERGAKPGWKNIDKNSEGVPSVSGCLCCSQQTHSQAGGRQGRRPPWRTWGPLISAELFALPAIWLAPGCVQMNTPAPKGAGEGWFLLDTLPADIYPQVSKAPASSRLHNSHRMLQGNTFLGRAESQGIHSLRLDLHLAQMGECHFKVWMPQRQKCKCSSPRCNLWKAANIINKKAPNPACP